jgi:hypothetical protein
MPGKELNETLESIANQIISQLRKEFPNAEYLINGEVYGACPRTK